MVYIDTNDLNWFAYVQSWMQRLSAKYNYVSKEIADMILGLFEKFVDKGLGYIKINGTFAIHQVDMAKVNMMCQLFESISCCPGGLDKISNIMADKGVLKTFIIQCFVFSYVWSLGGNLLDDSRDGFEILARDQCEDLPDSR